MARSITMKKTRLAVLSGGTSNERDISLLSGDQVCASLDKEKYTVVRYDPKTDLNRLVADSSDIDMALIIMHGASGEDGRIQGMLDLMDIPYQGSGVLGSALAMNKITSKQLYQKAGLPIPGDIVLGRHDLLDRVDCVRRLGLPVVVKPASGGSSVGVSIVRSEAQLQNAVDEAFFHDESVIVESYVDGVELTCGIIGNADLQALPVVEIVPEAGHDFFDYAAKYTDRRTREICPARIDDGLTETVQTYAKMAHRALFCDGYSRTDMILKEREIYVIETNTIPGMTDTSLFPLAAGVAGITFSELLDRLIELGIERHRGR